MRNDVSKEVMKGFNSYQNPTPVHMKAPSAKNPQKTENNKSEQKETEQKIDLSEEKKYLSENQIKNLPDNLKAGIIKKQKEKESNGTTE